MATMKVDVSTELDCSAAKVWNEVQTSALLLHVIWSLARIGISALPDLPEHWGEGQKVQCRVYVFGFIPLGVRELFEKVDQSAFRIVTRESDRLVRSWDHTISVTQFGANRSMYRDMIDIDAGRLTVLVWRGPTGFTGIARSAGGRWLGDCSARNA
jgi:hypothetical protein